MPNQQDWEHELLAYAAQLGPQHTQMLARIHAESGPNGVLQALAGTGLSRGALEVAAATMDGLGFAGAVETTQGRLQEIAHANVQTRSAEWLNENGIKSDPNAASPAHQVAALVKAGEQQGMTAVETARQVGLAVDPAEAAASAERSKRGEREANGMQRLLEHPDFHRAAAGWGKSAPALLKELKALAELGDFEAIQQKTGMFKDAADAREILGPMANLGATDRLVAELGETDGEALPGPTADPESWESALSEQWNKVAAKQHRALVARSRSTEIDDPERYDVEAAYRSAHGESHEGMVGTPRVKAYVARRSADMAKEAAHDGDDWGAHLERSWDRESARISGGDEAAAAYDRQQSSMSGLASEFESEADAAESEAA